MFQGVLHENVSIVFEYGFIAKDGNCTGALEVGSKAPVTSAGGLERREAFAGASAASTVRCRCLHRRSRHCYIGGAYTCYKCDF